MRIIKKRTIILIFLSTFLGIYLGYMLFSTHKKNSDPWTVPNTNNISKKFITKDALVDKIQQKQELITMEADLVERVVIDESWGNLSIFKKIQNISFSGTGTYTIDLSKLTSDNIELMQKEKKVVVKVPEPTAKNVSINDEKTVYETTERGFLRFGEVQLTAPEHQILNTSVKEKMLGKMREQQYYSEAIKSSENIIKILIQNIIENNADDKYNIVVEFTKAQ